MFVFSLVYIVGTVCIVVLLGLMIRAKKRSMLIAALLVVVGIPVFVAGLLFVLKSPIQQGKILPNTALGPIVNLFFPPPDLYYPLAVVKMEQDKSEYMMRFSVKYPGNHALLVTSPTPAREEPPRYDDIAVRLSVRDGETDLFKTGPKIAGKFVGRDEYGTFCARFRVPQDIPIASTLTANVTISGDLRGFLDRRGTTELKIRKISDQ